MRLVANSFPPNELNKHGFGIYADFRPQVEQWGGRSEVSCSKILGLRREPKNKKLLDESEDKAEEGEQVVPAVENADVQVNLESIEGGSPKKQKTMQLEDYEDAFNDINDEEIAAAEFP
jgi:hypothetical protein